MKPRGFFHQMCVVTVRVATDENGSIVVIENKSLGIAVQLTVLENENELQPEMVGSEHK